MKPSKQTKVIDEGVWDSYDLKELKNEKEELLRPTQWGVVSADTYKALSVTKKRLAPGAYTITRDMNDGQPIFFKKDIQSDDTLLVGGLTTQIAKEIQDFWMRGAAFEKYGFLHSRGYLLYGNQGVGKSSIVNQVVSETVAKGGVVFICGNPEFFILGLKVFRQTEPDRPIISVFEDIDAIIKKYGDDVLLSILDGANQINRVLNIATTNYPETLDKGIVSRPRRFDRVYKIEAPNDDVRREYLKSKLPKDEKLEKWVKGTKGISFAGLAECLISVLCLGNKFEDTIKVLKDLEGGHPSSDDFGSSVGFGTNEVEACEPSTSRRPHFID